MQSSSDLTKPLFPVINPQLTDRQIIYDLLKLALPIVLTDLSITLNIFINAKMLSKLPPEENSSAASAIIFSMQAMLTVVPSAFFYMIFSVIYNPNYRGKEKTIITNSLLMAMLLSIPVVIFSCFVGRIFSEADTENEVTQIVNAYYEVFIADLPFHLMAVALHQYAIARSLPEERENGRLKLLYLGGIINFSIVSGFSWLFTEVCSLPGLSKVQTIALSFVVGDMIRLFYYGGNFFLEGDLFETINEITWATHSPMFFDLFYGGWKLSVQLLSELGALTALSFLTEILLPNKIVNLDIFNAMIQYFLFSIIVPLALAQTAQQKLGQRCQEKHYDQVRTYGHCILKVSFLYNLICLILSLLISIRLARLFMNTNENNNTGMSGDFRVMFAIEFTGLFFTAIRNIIGMAMRPLEMINVPMMNSIASSWIISIPAAVLFSKYTDCGVAGILMGYYLGEMVGALNLGRIWLEVSQSERVKAIHDKKAVEAYIEEDSFLYWHCRSTMFEYQHLQESDAGLNQVAVAV